MQKTLKNIIARCLQKPKNSHELLPTGTPTQSVNRRRRLRELRRRGWGDSWWEPRRQYITFTRHKKKTASGNVCIVLGKMLRNPSQSPYLVCRQMLSCLFSLSDNNISVFNWFTTSSKFSFIKMKHPFWYCSASIPLAITSDTFYQSVIWIVILIVNQRMRAHISVRSPTFWLKWTNKWTWHHPSSGRRWGRLQKAYRPEERQASCLLTAADRWICGQSHRSGLWAQSCPSS